MVCVSGSCFPGCNLASGLLGWLSSKESACQCRRCERVMGSILGSGRLPRGGKGNPLQYSCLKNSTNRGAWWATVHGVSRVGHDSATKQQLSQCLVFVLCLVAQLCPTLCNPMDCSLPDTSVHEVLQARILEWVAMPSSRGSSQPRGRTQVSHIAGRFFTN